MPTNEAPNRDVRAHLESAGGLRFSVSFPGLPESTLTIDEAPPLGLGEGPNPSALLAGAVAGCLAASLTFCLHKARIDPEHVSADAVAHVTRNEAGRFRIGGIDVELSVALTDDDATRLARCDALFEDFCIVTESVRHGIPVNVQRQLTRPQVGASSHTT